MLSFAHIFAHFYSLCHYNLLSLFPSFLGFFSNHSLRATCASRLYHSGIDEQLISRQTGHRSLAIREYKRTSSDQQLELSKILQHGKEKSSKPSSTVSSAPVATSVSGQNLNINININVSKKDDIN
jgi:hypothetical protein